MIRDTRVYLTMGLFFQAPRVLTVLFPPQEILHPAFVLLQRPGKLSEQT